jgi:hypothetical protein
MSSGSIACCAEKLVRHASGAILIDPECDRCAKLQWPSWILARRRTLSPAHDDELSVALAALHKPGDTSLREIFLSYDVARIFEVRAPHFQSAIARISNGRVSSWESAVI